ncbi:uncharacterized protein LOC108112916 isoform X2 [Drosophila eugracilis]|uniref:uncharacterized protein LOC108112916 isoform X2 n=1 Tax=Drosophila eugracilis TaxID=29029 RepID=UPI0007E87B7E|nr:uncharacterized protein LOC108112916 isoform X2 [Drosophila eugracilis]
MTCDDKTEALVAHMCDLVQFYMLPELKEDLDNIQLDPSQFESYHALLVQDLPKLYDLVQEFLQKDGDAGHEELKVKLLLLICELTASPTIYQLKDDSGNLLKNANELARQLSSKWWESTDVQMLKYYEKKLHRDCWKKQLGAVHGFGRYMELRYGDKSRMPTQMLAFALSVGLNVRECYDPTYKQLGVKIFSVMLKFSNSKDIQELNVHSVIYDHALKDAYNMESIEAIDSVWNCLYLCLDHFVDLDAFTFVTRLGCYFTINRRDVEAALATDISQPDKLELCREECLSLNASTSYRWAKAILQMLVLESDKLLQGVEVCYELLGQMMRCYLVCILPIPLQALHPHLPEFYAKFVAVLMECLVAHERDPKVLKLVLRFTEIFSFQLENGSTAKMPKDLAEFTEALKIIHRKIFE